MATTATLSRLLLRQSLALNKGSRLLFFPSSNVTAAMAATATPTRFVKVRTMTMYTPIGKGVEDLDPEKIFNDIDTNNDGVISKEEFVEALNRLNYYDLLKLHTAAHANMEEKLKTLSQIEDGMEQLKESYKQKQEAYSNVGMMTGAEIDALFDKSQSQKDEIHTLLGDLKALIGHSVYSGKDSFSNVGMMTSTEIDSLFPPDDGDDEVENNDKRVASN